MIRVTLASVVCTSVIVRALPLLKLICLFFFFQFAGYQSYDTRNCSMWVYSNTEGYKENTYTMYTTLTNPVEPVHYEMMGYDTLLGSHYDKYEVDYADFSDEMPPSDVFYITQGLAIF